MRAWQCDTAGAVWKTTGNLGVIPLGMGDVAG